MRGLYSIFMMTGAVYLVYGKESAGWALMVLTGLWMFWIVCWKIYDTPG